MNAAAFEFDTARFDRAIAEIAKDSTRTDEEIITMNAGMMMRSIAYNSPRKSGNMNGGWLPAWNALALPGTPNTRRSAPHRRGAAVYMPEGDFVDQRRGSGEKSFTFINRAHAIDKGKRVNYPHIVAARTGFMRKAEAEVERKFERILQSKYRRMLRRRSR